MLEPPLSVEISDKENQTTDFLVQVYKDMEFADEIETCDEFDDYFEALDFYNEVRMKYNDKVFIELIKRVETIIDDKTSTTEEYQLAHNYIISIDK